MRKETREKGESEGRYRGWEGEREKSVRQSEKRGRDRVKGEKSEKRDREERERAE